MSVKDEKSRQELPETVGRECPTGSNGLNPGTFEEDFDGAFMRGFKAAMRRCASDFDRGVVAGLSQAAAICSDREDMTAELLKGEIEELIRLQVNLSSHEHESMAGR